MLLKFRLGKAKDSLLCVQERFGSFYPDNVPFDVVILLYVYDEEFYSEAKNSKETPVSLPLV